MARKALVDEAHDVALEEVGGVAGDSMGFERLVYASAYEAVIRRTRRGRRRGLGVAWERGFYRAVIRVAKKRLEEV